jgi:hypothetical protein
MRALLVAWVREVQDERRYSCADVAEVTGIGLPTIKRMAPGEWIPPKPASTEEERVAEKARKDDLRDRRFWAMEIRNEFRFNPAAKEILGSGDAREIDIAPSTRARAKRAADAEHARFLGVA